MGLADAAGSSVAPEGRFISQIVTPAAASTTTSSSGKYHRTLTPAAYH
jgi:hypothetical protein